MAFDVIGFLNMARVEAGYEERIPEINKENLRDLTLQPPEVLDKFVNVLAKIVRQYIYDTTFDRNDNPFADLYREKLEVGMSVEDLYVDLITGSVPAWDDDGSVALSRVKPNVTALYHTQNYEMQYKVSESYAQMKEAFLSMGTLDSMKNRILGTLKSSSEYDLYLETLELISTSVMKGAMNIIKAPSYLSSSTIPTFLKLLKDTVDDMQMMGNKYNYYGFTTKTKPEDLIIITKPKYLNTIDVDYLAGVFNLSKAEITDKIIKVPNDYGFGILDREYPDCIYAIICDKRMFRIFPTLHEGGSIYNPAGLFTNVFLTLQYIFSFGLFFNCAVLARENPNQDDGEFCALRNMSSAPVAVEYSPGRFHEIPNGSTHVLDGYGTFKIYVSQPVHVEFYDTMTDEFKSIDHTDYDTPIFVRSGFTLMGNPVSEASAQIQIYPYD